MSFGGNNSCGLPLPRWWRNESAIVGATNSGSSNSGCRRQSGSPVSLIDSLLVGTIVVVAGFWMLAPRGAGRWLLLALLALAALAVLQVAVEGFYWQFLPGYFLAVVIALLAVFRR